MAVDRTIIESVRLVGADGVGVEYPWQPNIWYLIRDDHPYLDILTRGRLAMARGDTRLQSLDEPAQDGTQWQRWDFETELARQRRLGEMSLPLKVPKDCALRCYVIPTSLLNYRDVVAMVEDIEEQVGFAAAWDMIAERPERSWSRRSSGSRMAMPSELVRCLDEELRAALSIRSNPFKELGPHSRRGVPLAENAIVSHWAMRRWGQLRDSAGGVAIELRSLRSKGGRSNPDGRQVKLDEQIRQLSLIEQRLERLKSTLARLGNDSEMATVVYPSPLFQRDYRLRTLLRAFAPPVSEALSDIESSRSHYPPVFLNSLWELWGAVWLVKELRRLGFSGSCLTDGPNLARSCSWRLKRDDIVIELDFEPEPVFVDYEKLPPAHERDVPALEWAARNQELDPERPYLGLEMRCSPDYLVRITTPNGRFLMVGDASLASPRHHGKKVEKADAKPFTVERYRRTMGWSIEDQVVRCHPMGGFVIFPSPASAWVDLQRLPGAGDCTLLCPSPLGDREASRRLEGLLFMVAPEIRTPMSSA
ncbi:hypothetical protein FJW06_24540 [Mesorhizobium sp. B4-1-3]|uniref:hypothetical protein n=1 Tax=Mesorhizobium sp. B4-1-3 TaxID=2589889 RepID=UPI0011264EF2|nr:hypothetical protein [Mesorhizobium sp. B4-1-3]TPI09923.1 hypothetical protein FJW06_24540 [Mesorhizobium sp. B4-1-3]